MSNVAKAKSKRRITPLEVPKFSEATVKASPEFAEAIRNIAISLNHNFGACLEEIADIRERFSVDSALIEMRDGFTRIESLVRALAPSTTTTPTVSVSASTSPEDVSGNPSGAAPSTP